MKSLAVLCLILAAGVVSSSDDRRREAPPQAATAEDLDVSLLYRPRRVEPVVDVFAARVPPPPPTPAAPVAAPEPPPPPPKPVPPALPFRYVGKFVEQGALRLLLSKGDVDYHVAGGETLDGVYRVEEVSESQVLFTYLPLNEHQTLSIPASEAPQ